MTNLKVLFIDDEKAFVDTMTKRLTKRGIDTVPAFNGKEALDRIKENSAIEVVILDIKMPVMDGMAALKAIKRKYPPLEVIMLTGHATVESAIEGMKMGAFDYLMKPCDMDQLVTKVEAAAKQKRQHEQRIVQMRKWGRLVSGV
ncbi:response regulator [Desulfosarcina ovata subsp. sediminis]|uniref:Response regulator n=1 Tax=Desulfosarcina ovata subsp. sediminis TaxID=885957 RepID=A0A5K8A0C9_9BACT|nr:response regulator [Desulfosarcina ovata]BBO85953.1 response regulator [Desulfosarcina ovata subsp. sediminis]